MEGRSAWTKNWPGHQDPRIGKLDSRTGRDGRTIKTARIATQSEEVQHGLSDRSCGCIGVAGCDCCTAEEGQGGEAHRRHFCRDDALQEEQVFSIDGQTVLPRHPETRCGRPVDVFAKVWLLDVLWLSPQAQNRQRYRNMVQSKHVDFVLCDPDALFPTLAIELDHSSHARDDRERRDEDSSGSLAGAADNPCWRGGPELSDWFSEVAPGRQESATGFRQRPDTTV